MIVSRETIYLGSSLICVSSLNVRSEIWRRSISPIEFISSVYFNKSILFKTNTYNSSSRKVDTSSTMAYFRVEVYEIFRFYNLKSYWNFLYYSIHSEINAFLNIKLNWLVLLLRIFELPFWYCNYLIFEPWP